MTSQDSGLTAKPSPKWQKWLSIATAVVLFAVAALRLIGGLTEANSLPGCDSKRAKDSLSDIFKQKQLNPTSYSEVKTLSSTDDLVECQATLPAGDQGILDINYKFVRNGSNQQIQYTISTKPK